MNLKTCENITKLNIESQNQKLRLFEKLDIETKIRIFENHTIIFHKLKNNHKDIKNSILSYCAFLLSLDNFQKSTDKETIKVIKFNNIKHRKYNKREKLLQYWPLITQLKKEKMSFRDIYSYLQKNHKVNISYSSIYKIWNQIEFKEDKKDENSFKLS